jgi:phospholipase/carboxylesterase
MRLLSITLALCTACCALAACAADRTPAAAATAQQRFSPPDASGFGQVGELSYLEEILGDAAPTDTLPMLVLLHGRGDEPSRRWLPLAPSMPVRVIMPRAPLPFGDGYSWFEIRALEAKGPRGDELGRQLAERADQLAAAIEVLRAKRPTRGVPIAAGFSQGGMLSYTLAVRHPKAFRALMPIAGLLPQALWPKTLPAGAPTLLALHGTLDQLVPIDDAREAVRHLTQIGYRAELREFEGVGHSIANPVLDAMRAWLNDALANN